MHPDDRAMAQRQRKKSYENDEAAEKVIYDSLNANLFMRPSKLLDSPMLY